MCDNLLTLFTHHTLTDTSAGGWVAIITGRGWQFSVGTVSSWLAADHCVTVVQGCSDTVAVWCCDRHTAVVWCCERLRVCRVLIAVAVIIVVVRPVEQCRDIGVFAAWSLDPRRVRVVVQRLQQHLSCHVLHRSTSYNSTHSKPQLQTV